MGKEFTPLQLDDISAATTAVNALNKNYTNIETALEDILSRAGLAPNVFNSDYGMNSNNFENLLSNLGDEPDIFVTGMSLLGTVITFTRSQGEPDITVDVGPIAQIGQAFKGATAYRNTFNVLSSPLPVTIPWQFIEFDTDSFFDLGTDDTLLTIPAGVSTVHLTFGCSTSDGGANSGTQHIAQLLKNGSTFFGGSRKEIIMDSIGNGWGMQIDTPRIPVVQGDTFTVTWDNSNGHTGDSVDAFPTVFFCIEAYD